MSLLPEGFDFVPVTDESLAEVMRLYRDCIQPLWLKEGRDHDLHRVEANIRAHLGADDYSMTLVVPLAAGGTPVAYLAWEKHPDHTSKHMVAHLRMILVQPGRQGSGLGQLLMTWFESQAREAGCTKVQFDVITGSPARGFYQRLGYRHWSDYMEKLL